MNEKDFKKVVFHTLDFYVYEDEAQELRTAMTIPVFVHAFYKRCEKDSKKYNISLDRAVFGRIDRELLKLKKMASQKCYFALAGLADLFGGKIWFVYNPQLGFDEWYRTKKECISRIRQLYDGDSKKNLISKLQGCKGRAFVLKH